jgi:hypothetical protein
MTGGNIERDVNAVAWPTITVRQNGSPFGTLYKVCVSLCLKIDLAMKLDWRILRCRAHTKTFVKLKTRASAAQTHG